MGLKKYLNKIVEADAIDALEAIPNNSIHMTFADPPFNLNKKYSLYDDDKKKKEYLNWCKKWIDEMIRITDQKGSIFVHNIPKWLTYFAAIMNESKNAFFKSWIAWDALSRPLGKGLMPNHYGILWYVKSKDFKFRDIRTPHERCRSCGNYLADYGGKKDQMHPFGSLIGDVITDIHRYKHNKRRDKHPCQLPVPLLERLILMCTDEDEIVLDPFIGTGTSAIASKKLGRKYIGIDIDPKYVEMTRQKLKDTKPVCVNGAYVSVYLDKVMTIRDRDFEKLKDSLETFEFSINEEEKKQHVLPEFTQSL